MNKETTFYVPYIFSSLNLQTNIGVLTSNRNKVFYVPYIFSLLNLKTNIGMLTSNGNKVNFFTNTWYTALSTDYMPHEDYFTAVIILTFVINETKNI